MNIYVMDTDFYVLKNIEEKLKKLFPKDNIKYFTNTETIWKLSQTETPDVMILEAESYGCYQLVCKIREQFDKVKIILLCNEESITPKMINMNLFGIIKKPIEEKAMEKIMLPLHHPIISKIKSISENIRKDEE